MTTSRRAFLSGRAFRGSPDVMRPPGEVRDAFSDLCTACGDCITACPPDILKQDAQGRPEIQLAIAPCTFCGQCADACASGALDLAHVADWPWRASISAACLSLNGISCRACQDGCDSGAIRFKLLLGGRAEPVLDSDVCTGCGACASTCPASAVTFHRCEERNLEAAE